MRSTTPADMNPQLAIAIGRFSQACNQLEHDLARTLIRLLPLTDQMGSVLFSGNMMRRNTEILRALLLLPEIPIENDDRDKLKALPARITSLNSDRSRIMHNRMIGGHRFSEDEPTPPLMLLTDRSDGSGPEALEISIEMIDAMTTEAKLLSSDLYIPPIIYDFSNWEASGRRYRVKNYPTPSQPKRGIDPRQKRKDRQKEESHKTIPSRGE